MSGSRRIKGDRVPIDYRSTQSFFESRGARQYANPLSATMYQDQAPELVEARDQAEKAAIESVLPIVGVRRVLDIGCGIGRWGWLLEQRCEELRYLGIDFSTSLIEMAHAEAARRGCRRLAFQVMSATDIQDDSLQVPPPYDLILVSGLLIYLNDEDCVKLLADAARLCAPDGVIYLREPVGVDDRFTLDRFYSEELAGEYSAIYRTVDEVQELMRKAFSGVSIEVDRSGFLFDPSLEKRVETRQYYFILRKRGDVS